MNLTYIGHSCFLLKGSQRILIDPCPGYRKEDYNPSIIAITHGHADHMGPVRELGIRTVAPNEIAKYLAARGIPVEPMNIGGTIQVFGITFTMTPALHSSWIEEAGMGMYGGSAAGFIISMDGVCIYHAGDTGLFSDMKLIGQLYHPDVALLPVGGRYTMGPREAMIAAEYIGSPLVIPMHYNTFPSIRQDLGSFITAIGKTTDMRVLPLQPGESTEISQRQT